MELHPPELKVLVVLTASPEFYDFPRTLKILENAKSNAKLQ